MNALLSVATLVTPSQSGGATPGPLDDEASSRSVDAMVAAIASRPATDRFAPGPCVETDAVGPVWQRLRWWRVLAIALSLFAHVGVGMLFAHASLVNAPVPVASSDQDALMVEFLAVADPKPIAKPLPAMAPEPRQQARKPLVPPVERALKIATPVVPVTTTIPEPQVAVAAIDAPVLAPAPTPLVLEPVTTAVTPQTAAPSEPVEAPLTASGKRAQSKYLRELMAWLAKHRVYPTAARKEKAEGVVQVRFSLDRDGHLLKATVQRSAGFNVLDQAALDVLRRAAPMPAFPKGLDRQNMTVSLPIDFSLQTD